MRSATVRVFGDRVEVRFPYEATLVAEIKACIPTPGRYWEPKKGVWVVTIEYLDVVRELLGKYRLEYVQTRPGIGGESPGVVSGGDSPRGRKSDWEVLYLVPGAPPKVVKAAFQALCQVYHPDRGGDPKKFIKLKDAYDRLVKKGA